MKVWVKEDCLHGLQQTPTLAERELQTVDSILDDLGQGATISRHDGKTIPHGLQDQIPHEFGFSRHHEQIGLTEKFPQRFLLANLVQKQDVLGQLKFPDHLASQKILKGIGRCDQEELEMVGPPGDQLGAGPQQVIHSALGAQGTHVEDLLPYPFRRKPSLITLADPRRDRRKDGQSIVFYQKEILYFIPHVSVWTDEATATANEPSLHVPGVSQLGVSQPGRSFPDHILNCADQRRARHLADEVAGQTGFPAKAVNQINLFTPKLRGGHPGQQAQIGLQQSLKAHFIQPGYGYHAQQWGRQMNQIPVETSETTLLWPGGQDRDPHPQTGQGGGCVRDLTRDVVPGVGPSCIFQKCEQHVHSAISRQSPRSP